MSDSGRVIGDCYGACEKQRLEAEIDRLQAGIRKHMNTRGDDRCHQDDHDLYQLLPDGDTRPAREVAVTLENCQRYIECRQQGREYISPQRRIEELEAEITHLKTMYDELKRAVWDVPGEPRNTEQELERISHQSTKEMATDQSLYLAEHSAGIDPVRLYQQIHALEVENHLLREELGR